MILNFQNSFQDEIRFQIVSKLMRGFYSLCFIHLGDMQTKLVVLYGLDTSRNDAICVSHEH